MLQADLADTDRLTELVAEIEATVGSVDILVNNAANRPNSKIFVKIVIAVNVLIPLKQHNRFTIL